MKTIIKIVLALLVIAAMFNGARVALNNYAFEDAVHEGLLFDPNASDPEIVDMVMKLAAEYQIPMAAEDIKVQSRGQDLVVNMTYTDNVVLVPGVFQRDWTFHPTTSTRMLGKGPRR